MNDKIQLAAIGEHMAEQQPLCMAKRIEELEAQVLVMAELLREAKGFVAQVFDSDINYWSDNPLLLNIDAAMAGKLSIHAEQHLAMVPEGWQLVQVGGDYFSRLVAAARLSSDKAKRKFPQPNYVLLKVAEEAGEVVQAGVHYAEGRKAWDELEGEVVQLLAMLIRLVTEGDLVNGIIPPDSVLSAAIPQDGTK